MTVAPERDAAQPSTAGELGSSNGHSARRTARSPAATAIRTRWSAWRQLGPRAGTATALRHGADSVRTPLHRLALSVRPKLLWPAN